MNDNFSVRGEVKLVDRQGNVLIDDHNMVVKLGRKFVMNRVLGESSNTISKLKFGYSKSLEEVTEDDDSLEVITNGIFSFTSDDESDSIPSSINEIATTTNTFIKYNVSSEVTGLPYTPYIKYVLYLHDKNLGLVNQLGLFTSDNDDTNPTDELFSKLNFEDVAITPDRDYLLTYTLYF